MTVCQRVVRVLLWPGRAASADRCQGEPPAWTAPEALPRPFLPFADEDRATGAVLGTVLPQPAGATPSPQVTHLTRSPPGPGAPAWSSGDRAGAGRAGSGPDDGRSGDARQFAGEEDRRRTWALLGGLAG